MRKIKEIKEKTRDLQHLKYGILATIFFTCMLSFLCVGFAYYTQIIQISGQIGLKPQGTFRITNVLRTAASNTDEGLPNFTDDSVDFNLTFIRSDEDDPVYTATYDIIFTNDTFYDRTISDLNLAFAVNDEHGDPLGDIDFTVTGIDSGGAVPKLSTATATVNIVFTPLVVQDSYTVDGGAEVESNEKPEGNLLAYLINSTGSIQNGAIASFQVNVMSTYENSTTFVIEAVSDKVEICDQNGNVLSSYTITGNNEGQNFTFYIKAKQGATFPDDTLTTNILLKSTGLPNVNAGSVTLDVDKTIVYVDTTPPIISNVVATINNTVGVVDLTWDGEDDYSGVSKYYIAVCNGSGTVLRTIDTASDNTSYQVTGLSEGSVASTYLFKVYAEDHANPANVASSTDIENATTASGYCSASTSASYQWVFKVTANISNGSYTGPTEVNLNNSVSGTINANSNYDLPSSITVTMVGNNNVTYNYNSNNGSVSVSNVTGDVTIRGTCNYNWCLAEGTDILLANHQYKKIEEIDYTDLLAVWNYDTGKLDYEYPIWIEKKKGTKSYQLNTFSDQSTLKTIGYHGLFSVDDNEFMSVDDTSKFKVGTRVYKVENNQLKIVTVTNIEQVEEQVNYYHVVSSRYYNIIANDFLTTDGTVILSNLYGFGKNVTWPSIRSKIIQDPNNLYEYKDLADALPYYMFVGMRAEEGKVLANYGLTLDLFKEYLKANQSAEGKYLEVNQNKVGEKLFMVTTSLDLVTSLNKSRYLKVEGSYYTLPRNLKVKCYLNSVDKKCYSGGERVRVTSPVYFEAIYR